MTRQIQIFLLLLVAASTAVHAVDGDLDDSFGGDGIVSSNFGTGPQARGPALLRIDDSAAGVWLVEQILDDPEGDHDWRISAERRESVP